jgi:hypothetical protein
MSERVDRDDERRTHPVRLTLTLAPAPEVDAGTAIVLKIQARCRDGCDLRGRIVDVVAPEGAVVAAAELTDFAEGANETNECAFKAPDDTGRHSWTVVLPAHEADDLLHEAASLSIGVTTLPHDTSLAVWDVPTPVVVGQSFRIHVGATCSAGCDLHGREILICDESSAAEARATLGRTPWEGTRGLYWTTVDLVAASEEGMASRSVRFAPAGLPLPHDAASARFGFETVRPPQCSVAIRITQKDTGTPVDDAQVRLGVYFACSDTSGLARIAVPYGTYSLDVLKTGYEMASRLLDVEGDLAVDVEAIVVPPENPDAYWLFDPDERI